MSSVRSLKYRTWGQASATGAIPSTLCFLWLPVPHQTPGTGVASGGMGSWYLRVGNCTPPMTGGCPMWPGPQTLGADSFGNSLGVLLFRASPAPTGHIWLWQALGLFVGQKAPAG